MGIKMERGILNVTISVVVIISLMLQLTSAYTSQSRHYRSTGEDGVERIVELVPSSVTVRPRPRQRISSDFARQYWVSGNFFNRENFKAIPTLNNGGNERSVVASSSFPRPMILSNGGRVVPVIATFGETIQEL